MEPGKKPPVKPKKPPGKPLPKKRPPGKKPVPGKTGEPPPGKKKLSNKTLRGVLIGCIAVVAIIAAGTSYYFHINEAEPEIAESPKPVDPLPENVRLLVDAGNLKDALDAVKQIVDQQPDNIPLKVEVMKLNLQAERYSVAGELAEKILEAEPNHGLSVAVQAVGYYRSALFEEALKRSLKAIELDPRQALAYRTIGDVYIRTGRYDDAIKVLKESVRLEKNNPEGWTKLSGAYIKKLDYKRAELAANAALEAQADYPGAHFNLAHIYFRNEEGTKAIKHIQMAEKLYRAQDNVTWVAKARQNKNLYIKHFRVRPEDISK